jgi:dTDP-4-amino-4,6-dideoxygalactose transaminase
MLPFIDLAAQRAALGPRVEEAILSVVRHGAYVMGPEVGQLEEELAAFCGAKHVVSCGSGTDALALVLMAKGVKPGDAILCPSFTFAATAEVICWLGASPVFIDVREDTFNLDIDSIEAGLVNARERGLRPVGMIPVDLFGQPADYAPIEAICAREGLWLLADAAQSFGAQYQGRKVGTIGDATATSFFPAKPLGCYGDGGAIFTDDSELDAVLRSLRNHGQGADRYEYARIGMNGRLDTIQAAVLIEKLRVFADEIAARDRIAARYAAGLSDCAMIPQVMAGSSSVWAQYTLRVPGFDRSAFQAQLRDAGVPTAIYYPRPLHRQDAYAQYPSAGNGLPVTDRLAQEVVSLPMHPYLGEADQDHIIATTRAALGA